MKKISTLQKMRIGIGFLCAILSQALSASYDVSIGGKKYQVDTPSAENKEAHSQLTNKNISYKRVFPISVKDSVQNEENKDRLYHYPVSDRCTGEKQNYLLGQVSLVTTKEVREYSPEDKMNITMSWYDVKGGNRLRKGPKGIPIEHKKEYTYARKSTYADFGPYPVPPKAGHIVVKSHNMDLKKLQWFPRVEGILYFSLYQSGCIYPPAIP